LIAPESSRLTNSKDYFLDGQVIAELQVAVNLPVLPDENFSGFNIIMLPLN